MKCLQKFKRWSYVLENNKCLKFIYGGCLGNENRFYSEINCVKKCVE